MSGRYAQMGSATTVHHPPSCDNATIHACSTSLLQRLADRNAYGAVVADACEFNRGLSRRRASRLPFVDLATRTKQRPAPWLYRPQCDRFKATDAGSHIVLRYLRHRWRLDSPPLSRRRAMAADRLWCTLQTGLSALGVPSELVPMVTKRAYAIAGLPVPSLLSNGWDNALCKQGLIPHSNGANGTVNSSVAPAPIPSNTGTGSNNTSGRTAALSVNSLGAKRISGISLEPTTTDMSKRTHTRNSVVSGADEDVDMAEELTEAASRTRQMHQEDTNPSVLVTIVSEDSAPSNEAASGGMRRAGVPQSCVDEETRTDDEIQSVQSGNGGIVTAVRNTTKAYDIDPDGDSEEDEDQAGDGDGDDDPELDEELDDVEWLQSGRRRNARSFTTRRSFNGSRASRAFGGSSKGGRFGLSGNRLPARHTSPGKRNPSGRQKTRSSRSELAGSMATVSTTGRRSTRSSTGALNSKTGSSATGMRDVDKKITESWDKFDEPGFQPNATLNPPTNRTTNESSRLTNALADLGYPSQSSSSWSITDGLQLTSDINSRGSPAVSFAEPIRRHPNATDVILSTGSVTGATASMTSSTTGVNISGVGGSCPLTSIPQSSNVLNNASTKPSTMVQLLSSCTSNGACTTTITRSSGSVYEYRSVISTDSGVREAVPRPNSDWLVTVSSAGPPPNKLMKEIINTSGTPSSRPVSDYASSVNQSHQSCRLNVNPSTTSTTTATTGAGSSDPFTSPVGATTTVTFFVCEVCASRYRSTAGLRYHYHSQHSGYTPKNPISASASRLVVPVGEERGIGGGLRGGRPRRSKGNTVDARGGRGNKLKDNEAKTYGDINLGSLGGIRSNAGDMSGGNNGGTDGFKEPNILQPSASDHSSTFSPNYLAIAGSGGSSGGNNINIRSSGDSSPTRNTFYRGTNYSPKHQMEESLKTSCGMPTTPLTSMGLMASSFGSSINESSGLVELNQTANSQRLHPTGSDLVSAMNSRTLSSSSPSTTHPIGPATSYHTVPWTGTDPYMSGPASAQLSSLENCPTMTVGGFARLTPAQRRYERQHCSDRVSPGVRPPNNGPHCVYCLGDDRLNPRLGRPESLLRCFRCAQWAHFTCLRLPQHVIEAAMRYPWQCIDCKMCWLCGSPEEEHRMVFCSDCDRAFHVDCLPTPMPRVPDGTWSCDICLHEIYSVRKSGQGSDKFVPIPHPPDPSTTSSSAASFYLLKNQ